MSRVLDKIDIIILSVIAVLIPLYSRAVPILMLCLFLTTLLKKETYTRIPAMLKSFNFYILVSPFLFIVIGYFYSDNKIEAFKGIETAASLIIFGVIYFLSIQNNRNVNQLKNVLRFFVVGVLISYVVLWINIIPKYLETKETILLMYSQFSMIIKTPNHLSYNVLFALIICLVDLLGETTYLFNRKNKLTTALCFALFFVLSVYLFQLLAKSTIIIYFIVLIIALVYAYKKKIIKIYFLLVLLISVGGISTYMFTIPRFKHRFDSLVNIITNREGVDYSKKESSTVRYSAAKSSLMIIQDNWFVGVGTGDVVDELEKSYAVNHFTGASLKHTNPHNQFLRSFVLSGIFGLLSLLLLFYVLARSSLRDKSILSFLYFLSTAMIFLIDDVFIFRDGVVFFGFFAPYFIFCGNSIKSGFIKNQDVIKL